MSGFFAITAWLVAVAATGSADSHHKAQTVHHGFVDVVTNHVIPMRKQTPSPSTHPALHRRTNRSPSAPLRNIYDVYYIIDLVVGNQTIPVSVDTGSSDTWMVQEPYQCASLWYDPIGSVGHGDFAYSFHSSLGSWY